MDARLQEGTHNYAITPTQNTPRTPQGGEPHILDSVRDVVALHRDRVVFPLQLCVTKLSGIGT